MPATVPATVLLGETLGAIGLLPNCEPTKNPTTSYATVQITTPRMRPTPLGARESSPAKLPSPPTYANASTVVATPSSGRPGVTSPQEPQHREHDDQREVRGNAPGP